MTWDTPDRKALRDLARTVVAKEIAPNIAEWERAGELPSSPANCSTGGAMVVVDCSPR